MKSIIFRESYYEALSLVPPEDRIEVVDAIFRHIFDGKEINPKGKYASVVTLICSSIDSDYQRYMEAKERGAYIG